MALILVFVALVTSFSLFLGEVFLMRPRRRARALRYLAEHGPSPAALLRPISGAIYLVLDDLEDKGFVKSRARAGLMPELVDRVGRAGRIYEITPAGRASIGQPS